MNNGATTKPTNTNTEGTMAKTERNAQLTLNINHQQVAEFWMVESELNEVPETTAYDLSQAIASHLNAAHEHAEIEIILEDRPEEQNSPKLSFTFTNGRRGWEARRDTERWILMSLSLLSEHTAQHGPISSDRNRSATLARERANS